MRMADLNAWMEEDSNPWNKTQRHCLSNDNSKKYFYWVKMLLDGFTIALDERMCLNLIKG